MYDTEELMAIAMYNDWKSRERIIRDSWEDTSPSMRAIFIRKAAAAMEVLVELGAINEDYA